jgi:hypothetical protein
MQIVIDVPEEEYNTRQLLHYFGCYSDKLDLVIYNGTPLPKGHGDLVDRDAIEVLRIGNIKREYDKGFDAGVSCMVNRILETPTIIEGSEGE